MRRGDDAQATVETALLLPVVLLIVLGVAQVGLIVRDQLLVTHAAREGARMSAVSSDGSLVTAAVHDAVRIDADRLRVDVRRRDGVGGVTTVRVTMTSVTPVPLVGAVMRGRSVSAEATMLVESSPRTESVDGSADGSTAMTLSGESEDRHRAEFVEGLVPVAAFG